MTDRLNDLEARITLMDDLLDALQLQLKHVYAQVQGMQPAERADAQQDIPPHY